MGYTDWKIKRIEVPIVVSEAAYDDNDVIGGLLSMNASSVQGGGFIQNVTIVDDAAQKEPLKLYVYEEAPATIDDGDAFAPADADYLLCIGCVEIPAAQYREDGTGTPSIASVPGYDYGAAGDFQEYIHFANPPNGKLYFYLVAEGGTPDYVNDDDLHVFITVYLA